MPPPRASAATKSTGIGSALLPSRTKMLYQHAVDKCKATGYSIALVKIRNFVHKGLKRLYLDDSAKCLPPDAVDKLRAMLTMRMLNPVHPGRFLRTEIIEAHDLSVTDAAKILGVSRPTLSSLLNAKAALSGDMALRFEKAFGVDMDTLMRMQNSYDIARTRSREKKIRVERYEPRPAA
jgi:antitoxin HigA-1